MWIPFEYETEILIIPKFELQVIPSSDYKLPLTRNCHNVYWSWEVRYVFFSNCLLLCGEWLLMHKHSFVLRSHFLIIPSFEAEKRILSPLGITIDAISPVSHRTLFRDAVKLTIVSCKNSIEWFFGRTWIEIDCTMFKSNCNLLFFCFVDPILNGNNCALRNILRFTNFHKFLKNLLR